MAQTEKLNLNEIRKSTRHETFDSCSRHEKNNATLMRLLEKSSEYEEKLHLEPKWN